MKLRKLTIHNLASIGDAEIDFLSPELDKSEVFLISGETGSGKSTILDAICLALYAEMPRMATAANNRNKIPDADSEVKSNDVRLILRGGTLEGFCRLEFEGNDGIVYTAEWKVRRASRKRAATNERRLQRPEWSLSFLTPDGIMTYTKDAEIQPMIRECVGLDYEQFCRTTMLAQGEFTKFLNSNDEEKAAILEKITGTRRFSKIGAMIFRTTAEKLSEYEEANSKLRDLQLLPEEEVKRLGEELTVINGEISSLNKEKEEVSASLTWTVQNEDYSKRLENTIAELGKAVALRESDNIVAAKTLLAKLRAVDSVRQSVDDNLRAAKGMEECRVTAENIGVDYARLVVDSRRCGDYLSDLEREIGECESAVAAEGSRTIDYANSVEIVSGVRELISSQRELSSSQTALASLYEILPELEKRVAARQTAVEECSTMLMKEVESERSVVDRIEKMDVAELRNSYVAATERQNYVESLLMRVRLHIESRNINDSESSEIERIRKNLSEGKKEYDELCSLVAVKEAVMRERTAVKESMTRTAGEWARKVRSELKVGDICPVCRNVISELPEESVLSSLEKEANERYEAARLDLEQLNASINSLAASLAGSRKALEKREADLKRRLDDFEKERHNITEAYEKLDLPSGDGVEVGAVVELKEKLLATISRLKEKLNEADEATKELIGVRSRVKNLREEHTRATKLCDSVVSELNVKRGNINGLKEQISRQTESLVAIKLHVVKMIAYDGWSSSLVDEPESFLSEFQSAYKVFCGRNERIKTLKNLRSVLSQALENLQLGLEETSKSYPQWNNISLDSESAGIELSEESAEGLVSGLAKRMMVLSSAAAALTERLNGLQEIHSSSQKKIDVFLEEMSPMTRDDLDSLLQTPQKETDAISDRISSVDEAISKLEGAKMQIERSITDHIAHKPVGYDSAMPNETLICRMDGLSTKITSLTEKRALIFKKLDDDSKQRRGMEALVAEMEAKKQVYEQWDSLNRLLGDKEGKVMCRIAQSYILGNLLSNANHYLRRLTPRYELEGVPGTFVITLRDLNNGGTPRPASTLSGGESFLVSLALALALSDFGSRVAVDTVFIDEGFGTLSGTPLQNAITTLRSLHRSNGRRVGIISHVNELRETVKTRIEVTRATPSSPAQLKVVAK